MKKIIVVGMSAASVSFVVKLRSFDKESEIICFSGEKDFPYNRCLLADFLTDEKTQKELFLKPQDYFAQNNVTLHLGSWVTAIDTTNKTVIVSIAEFNKADTRTGSPGQARGRGREENIPLFVIPAKAGIQEELNESLYTQQFFYDELFLGIGTKPLLPSFAQNISSTGLFTFHTLQNMHEIKNYIHEKKVKTALVIGAGLNGIEAVSSLISLHVAVGLIEIAPTILAGQVDHQVAAWIADKVQPQGVALFTGRRAAKIYENNGMVGGVQLETGSIIFADMVIIAAGSQVNIELAQKAGITTQDGLIIVNEHMRTNIPSIMAGGDVCAVPDMVTKKLIRSTTWSDAMLQGLCAATTLSPNPRTYPGAVGLRDSYFFGKDFYACGDTQPSPLAMAGTAQPSPSAMAGTANNEFTKIVNKLSDSDVEILYVHQGCLKGFVLMGDISKVSELKRLYMTQEKCF
ncbi:MAG TPA: FAD-dependent oxidoreductase [Candidatus Saccharimonadales bacterium]|nr:FAD-dependent oxidoreductase [Candidatus Saccharimonadales bacterium]